MEFFNGPYLSEFFKSHLKTMRREVAALSPQEADKTDRDGWIDYFTSRYELDPLALYPDTLEIEQLAEKTVKRRNPWPGAAALGEPEYFDVPGIRASCKVCFSGNVELLKYVPSCSTMRDFTVTRMERPGQNGIGYLHFSMENELRNVSGDYITNYFEDEIQAFAIEMEYSARDTIQFNAGLRANVETEVDKRITSINKFATLRQSLNLPLNRIEGAPMAKPIPLVRKRIVFNKPVPDVKAGNGPAYAINDADYKHIIEIIDGCCSTWETSPATYAVHDEEDLRQMILGLLNSHYENATGETFRNRGKTDIYIPYENHAAYIAECKVWRGKSAFLKAVEQLFSYTTWRDTKVSVIIFNKHVADYQKVIREIGNALNERAAQVAQSPQSAQWSCLIQNSEDGRLMHTTVQAFNLYSPESSKRKRT